MKHWVASAVAALETSLGSVPYELNELARDAIDRRRLRRLAGHRGEDVAGYSGTESPALANGALQGVLFRLNAMRTVGCRYTYER